MGLLSDSGLHGDAQSQAVLAYLNAYDGIEASWNNQFRRYRAEVYAARWHNGREQGYVVYLRSPKYDAQVNIAFFEHRNSDEICAVEWEQVTTNPPTIDTAKFGDVYKTKHDVSMSVGPGEASEMAEWIFERLTAFWAKHSESVA